MPSVGPSTEPSPRRNQGVASWLPSELGSRVDFWGVAEADNVTLSGSDVLTFADLGSGGNTADGQSTLEPQWNATGWSDGSPAIVIASGNHFDWNSFNSTGNDLWCAAALDITTAAGTLFFLAYGASGGLAVSSGAYAIFDGAYKTAGTAATGKQTLLWTMDSGGSPTGAIYKDGVDLGALSPSDYDGTMAHGTGAYPLLGALNVSGGVQLPHLLKSVVFGHGVLTTDEVANLNAYVGAF